MEVDWGTCMRNDISAIGHYMQGGFKIARTGMGNCVRMGGCECCHLFWFVGLSTWDFKMSVPMLMGCAIC